MVEDAEKSGARWGEENDPCITRVGRVARNRRRRVITGATGRSIDDERVAGWVMGTSNNYGFVKDGFD
jgi:hypothetical protein